MAGLTFALLSAIVQMTVCQMPMNMPHGNNIGGQTNLYGQQPFDPQLNTQHNQVTYGQVPPGSSHQTGGQYGGNNELGGGM